MKTVLTGGDDYELAFTAAPKNASSIEALAVEKGLRVTRIGTIHEGAPKTRVLDEIGRPMDLGPGGYVHL
jgi:thiamine-monophosphate kinase